MYGIIGVTAFGLQTPGYLSGEERLSGPGVAFVSDYSLDGTLEPEDIPGLSNTINFNGADIPDATDPISMERIIPTAEGPVRIPEIVHDRALGTVDMLDERDRQANLLEDMRIEPPEILRPSSAHYEMSEKYALVQYRSKNSPQSAARQQNSQSGDQSASRETMLLRDFSGLNEEEQMISLRKSIRSTLTLNARRAVTTQHNTPGDVLTMALPYGADAKVYQPSASANSRDKSAAKGTYIYSIGTLCWNYPCSGKTLLRSDGKRVFARVGSGFQKRPAELLALLAMSNIMPNYELKVDGGEFTIGHLIASEKAAVSKGTNLSMALVGLAFYGEAEEKWKNEMGETWNFERMVTEELNRSIDQGSCDVTDWLLGLTAAVKLYEEEGKALKGPIALARKQLGTYQDFVLSVQNENFLWHPKFFLFKGSSPDAYETLYSSGHILRWLLLSLPESELNKPRILRAVASLASTVNRIPSNVATGSLTERQIEGLAVSLHALSIYNQRVFGDEEEEQKQETEKSVARR